MFLISRLMFETLYLPGGYLKIGQYNETNHVGHVYYFRFGAINQNGEVVSVQDEVTIPAHGYLPVWSLESFELKDRVLGLFGNTSDLFKNGLELLHSPFIDPGFNGALSLVIRNNQAQNVSLQPGSKIGKILFFDVSESMITADDFIKSKVKSAELGARYKAAMELERIAKQIKPTDG